MVPTDTYFIIHNNRFAWDCYLSSFLSTFVCYLLGGCTGMYVYAHKCHRTHREVRKQLGLADLAASTSNHWVILQTHLFANPGLEDKLPQQSPDADKLKLLLRQQLLEMDSKCYKNVRIWPGGESCTQHWEVSVWGWPATQYSCWHFWTKLHGNPSTDSILKNHIPLSLPA